MRKVAVSDIVMNKVSDLRIYLIEELQLSWEAAHKRTNRIEKFLLSLSNPADYPLCRFKKWRAMGYRCAIFEKDWVFAYELFEDGVIVRDMSHTSLLSE
jgi:hypothetical protein